jgi:hypothetical protein
MNANIIRYFHVFRSKGSKVRLRISGGYCIYWRLPYECVCVPCWLTPNSKSFLKCNENSVVRQHVRITWLWKHGAKTNMNPSAADKAAERDNVSTHTHTHTHIHTQTCTQHLSEPASPHTRAQTHTQRRTYHMITSVPTHARAQTHTQRRTYHMITSVHWHTHARAL